MKNDENVIKCRNEIYELLKRYNASMYYETADYHGQHAQVEIKFTIPFEVEHHG